MHPSGPTSSTGPLFVPHPHFLSNSSCLDRDEVSFHSQRWYTTKHRLTFSNRVNVGIICACLPTIRPIISRFFPHLLDSCPNNERYNSQTLRHDSSSPPQPNPSQVKYDAEQTIEAGSGSTITVVEAGEQGVGHTRDTTAIEENGRDIYVMTSMRQDFMERTPAVWQMPR